MREPVVPGAVRHPPFVSLGASPAFVELFGLDGHSVRGLQGEVRFSSRGAYGVGAARFPIVNHVKLFLG